MSTSINKFPTKSIYDELNEQTTLDLSSQHLNFLPEIDNSRLCVLFLQNNEISLLPDTIFNILPNLVYLDLRDNKLIEIPKTIKKHPCLTHLLLQNNKLTALPDELGTVPNLMILHLGGNPLTYPPSEIIKKGVTGIKKFLNEKYLENSAPLSEISEDTVSMTESFDNQFSQEGMSYNSVIDGESMKNANMSVKLSERDFGSSDEDDSWRSKTKCPKLALSRLVVPMYSQSSKYLKPLKADKSEVQMAKIKQRRSKDLAIKKHKEFLERAEKILQGRKNLEVMKNWRKNYMMSKYMADGSYKMDSSNFPYGTNPDYMRFLTREDIEKDLPDKYRKKLVRKSKPTVPRKSNNDVHLAMKIKQLFENLEAIDLNRRDMTPRSEQKVLLNEIQKISEIKQKLNELSTSNSRSVKTTDD